MIFIFIAVLIVLFVITWIVIATSAAENPIKPVDMIGNDWLRNKPFSEVMLESEVKTLRRANEMLNAEIEYVKNSCRRRHHQPPFIGCENCHPATRVYYAKSPDEQKIVDLLTKVTKPLDELKKEYGIK